jgi:enoyl-CoA hydratase
MNAPNVAPVLLSERIGAVLMLTLNRPVARNALNIELTQALGQAVAEFDQDASLRAAVLTGSDPAFCAGLDLKVFREPTAPRALVGDLLRSLPRRLKPLVGAINGAAMTGGLELALGCDFLIASERATFGDTHLAVGTVAGGGMNSRLPHAVGMRWSKQLSLTGQPINAATALRVGLVNEVVAHDQLRNRALQLAAAIATHDGELTNRTRAILDQASETTLADALRVEAEALAAFRSLGPLTWKK